MISHRDTDSISKAFLGLGSEIERLRHLVEALENGVDFQTGEFAQGKSRRKVIQSLDVIQQSLGNLALVSNALASQVEVAGTCDLTKAVQPVTLRDLSNRLLALVASPGAHVEDHSLSSDELHLF